MSESDNLLVRIQLEVLISEREGMIAMNKYREMRGETIAYGESDFFANAQLIRELQGRVRP